MPKAREEKEISNDGRNRTVTAEVGQPEAAGGGTKTAQWTVPVSPKVFQEMILDLKDDADGGAFVKSVLGPKEDSDESPLAFAHRMYCSAVAGLAKSRVYQQVAAESTTINVGGNKIDILSYPPKNLVHAINGMRSTITARAMDSEGNVNMDLVKVAEDGAGYGPWRNAAKKLVEGYTHPKLNKLVKATEKPAAEGEPYGTLELVG